jgi:hypothetical protein
MSVYRPLFAIKIEHEFFQGAACRDIEIVPMDAASALMTKLGLVAKAGAGKISVFFPADREDILRRAAADLEDAPSLTFRALCQDPYFSVYTYPSLRDFDGILYFDTSGSRNKDGAGNLLMHEGKHVSVKDAKTFAELSGVGLATARERFLKPAIVIHAHIKDLLADGENGSFFKDYAIRFSSKESRWRYYFFGEINNRDIQVMDLDGEIVFEKGNAVRFPGKKAGLSFVSTSPLPMRDVPSRRFQLRELKPKGEKTIIKRLPTANVSQVCREEFDGKGAFVSEIYVNC